MSSLPPNPTAVAAYLSQELAALREELLPSSAVEQRGSGPAASLSGSQLQWGGVH